MFEFVLFVFSSSVCARYFSVFWSKHTWTSSLMILATLHSLVSFYSDDTLHTLSLDSIHGHTRFLVLFFVVGYDLPNN